MTSGHIVAERYQDATRGSPALPCYAQQMNFGQALTERHSMWLFYLTFPILGGAMNVQEELTWRGLIQDTSDPELFSKLRAGDSFYIGFDPTARSLQVGNLVPLIVSIHLTRAGLTPILLFGGATGMIGDPGGKSAERNLLPLAQVAANVELQQAQARRLWESADLSSTPNFVNNLEWTEDVSVLAFLRDVGKHFTVNYMIAKDSVKSRLSGDGISYTEFSYMLLQAFDFLHLYQHRNCRLQIGGSDQWGNITAGLELIRRKIQGDAYALSFPLITNAQGKKFGKSEGNAVWLDATLTSPYKFHQFWLNVPDSDVIKLLKIFTLEARERIEQVEASLAQHPEQREAQKLLADSLCTLVHGAEATEDAKHCAQALFGGSLDGISPTQMLELFSDAPSSELPRSDANTIDIVTLLGSTLAKSKGEARRLIQGGGIYVDNERLSDETLKVSTTRILERGVLVLRSGKKNYHLVKLIDG
jgi:tyrosyl-tRNA synthetase